MGTLFLVGTPIGNLADVTLRALDTLRQVSLIAAEDTRTSRKLLSHYDIHTPLLSYYEHNRLQRLDQILDALSAGDVALVSESGMPSISDPGYHLVRAAIEAGFTVSPIPGPNAAIAALAASGLPTDSFVFVGFLPRQAARRRERLQRLASIEQTIILYESPHRVEECLADLLQVLGNRCISIARELTKVHEEFWRGTLEEATERFRGGQKGEFTLVVEGRAEEPWSRDAVLSALLSLHERGISPAEAAREVATEAGWPRGEVYRLGLAAVSRDSSKPAVAAPPENQMDLDSLDLSRVDPDGMYQRISELPEQILQAWELVKGLRLPGGYDDVDNVVILGMGGSAIGADLVRTLVESSAKVPIQVVRDYRAPAYVGGSSLVVASSYSGNTEETLSALDEAIAMGAKCVAVGTGGKLQERAQDAGIPFVGFQYQSAPRAAIGYSFMLIAGVLRAAGLLTMEESDLAQAADAMRALQREISPEVPTEHNAAKQLARKLHGRVAVVYGAGILSEVARRWKGQFNENSKAWAFFEVMPELNHNAVLGYANPEDAHERLAVIMLRSHLDHPRVKVRYDITAGLLRDRGVPCEMVEGRGHSPLEQMLTTIHFGDYVSVYLAYLYGSDPTPVDAISYLKEQLAQS